MSNTTISNLTAAASVNLADVLALDQGNATLKATQAQLLNVGASTQIAAPAGTGGYSSGYGFTGVVIGGFIPGGDIHRLTLARGNPGDSSAPVQFVTDAQVFELGADGYTNTMYIRSANSVVTQFNANTTTGSTLLTGCSPTVSNLTNGGNGALVGEYAISDSTNGYNLITAQDVANNTLTLTSAILSNNTQDSFGAQGVDTTSVTLLVDSIQHNRLPTSPTTSSAFPVAFGTAGISTARVVLGAEGTSGSPLAWTGSSPQQFTPDGKASTYILATPSGTTIKFNDVTVTGSSPALANGQRMTFETTVGASSLTGITFGASYDQSWTDLSTSNDFSVILTAIEALAPGTKFAMTFRYSTFTNKWIFCHSESY